MLYNYEQNIRLLMQIDKISSNLKIQYPLKLENEEQQADFLACKNFETSIYNQKNVTLPFKGLLSTPKYFDNKCIKLLRTARNGRRMLFNEADINRIINILKKESSASERLFILKEAFCLTNDDTIPDGENKIDFYDLYGEPISKKFFKDYLKLVSGRNEDDRMALLDFTKFEMDSDATEPIGAFLKLPESRKQELIPFIRRIAALNMSSFSDSDIDKSEYANNLYDYFRLIVYAIDDLSHTRLASEKRRIKNELLEITVNDHSYEDKEYADEATKNEVLNLIKDMNEYILERIVK